MSLVERALDRMKNAPRPEKIGALKSDPEGIHPPAADGEPSGPKRTIFVDREALRALGYLPETGQDRRFADEYRKIKRGLIASTFATVPAGQPSPRLIMLSSAMPGDGKTFTSINLALSVARERDTSVVLVDADVAKPHISRIFGVEKEPGLLDVLSDDKLDIESCVLPTDVGGLSILPAGGVREGATELIASARMKEMVARLVARNPRRIALFDSPPLLISSESAALTSVVGQVVLVVRSGKTPKRAVTDAIALVEQGKLPGLILNQGRRSLTEGLYGYGAYGSYGDETRTQE